MKLSKRYAVESGDLHATVEAGDATAAAIKAIREHKWNALGALIRISSREEPEFYLASESACQAAGLNKSKQRPRK